MTEAIETEIAELYEMTTGELAEKYKQLHGQPTRTRHRQYLIRKNAWRIQANAFGGLSERAKRRAAELANDADIRVMAPKTLVCPPQGGASSILTMRMAPREPEHPISGLGQAAGIHKRVHAHGPRHTHANELRAEVVDIAVIKRQLGYWSLLTTIDYLDHLCPSSVVGVVAARVSLG